MAKNEAKIRFTAETGEFNESIKKSNDSMKELTAELKLNSEKMKTAGASVEGLEEKHRILSAQLETAEGKTEALNQKLNKAAEIFGDSSTEVSKLRTQLLNAQAAEEKIKQAIDKCNSELDEQKSAANGAETETKQLDNALDDAGDSAKDAGDGFTILKGTLADLASSGIQAAISGIGELAGSIVSIGEDTKEYRTIMASLDNSSQLAGYSAEETAATFEHLNGVLGDSQASATTTANLQAIGLEQSKLQTLTDGVIGAWAKYGDSIPIDGLGEAINHTAQLGEVQGTLADVLEWGGLSVEDFNEKLAKCKDETERANLISQMLADQGLTEAGKAWQETNKDIVDLNNAQADYEANTAALADTVAPVTTEIKEGFNGVFEKCLELVGGVDFEGFAQTIEEAFGTFTEDILPKIVEGFEEVANGIKEANQWAQEHQGVLIAVGAAIGVVAGGIGLYNGVMAVKAAMDAASVTSVWGLVAAHWAQFAAAMAAIAPYILIVAAIAAVIAIVVLLIMYWDEVVAVVQEVWAKIMETLSQWGEWIDTNVIQPIVEFFSGLWQNIVDGFNAFVEGFQNGWNAVVEFFSGLWDGIVEIASGAWDSIVETATSVWETISNAVQVGIELIGSILSAAFDIITLPFRFIWENCKDIIMEAWDGIKNAVETAINTVKNVITTVFNAVKNFITTVWNAIKGFLTPILNAIKNTFTTVWNAIKNAVTTVINAIKSVITAVWNAIKSVVTTVMNAIKSGITTAWNAIKNTVSTVINAVKNTVSKIWNSIKTTTSNIWNGIKTAISNVWNGIKTGVSNAVNAVKNTVSNVFNKVKSTVSDVWEGIKNAITKPIEAAKEKVKGIVDAIKGFFSGLDIQLPKIKLPHFKIEGELSLNPPSVPHLAIEWYKEGGILTKPTIFGLNGNNLMAGGEAGAEAILPIEKLEGYIAGAIEKTMNVVNLAPLADAIEELANRPVVMNINGRQFATATAGDGDSVNGLRSTFKSRGLVLD